MIGSTLRPVNVSWVQYLPDSVKAGALALSMTFLYILIRKIKRVGERGRGWVLDCELMGTPRTRVHMWESMMALSLVV